MKAEEEKEFPLAEEELRRNKVIPAKYEKVILRALSHYPELSGVPIEFKLVKHAAAPYGTKPSMTSRMSSPKSRKYIVTILEKAKPPMEQALMGNMPATEQLGAIGHELAHVVQYQSRKSGLKLFKMLAKYALPSYRRKVERDADLCTIEHGLGKNLLAHANFIRKIPGYVENRKSIDKNYLLPEEIVMHLDAMRGNTKRREVAVRKNRANGKAKRAQRQPVNRRVVAKKRKQTR